MAGLLTVLFCLVIGGCGSPYLLSLEDTVCPSNDEETTLTGKLAQNGLFIFNQELADQTIDFYINDELLGECTTDSEGYAEITLPAQTQTTSTLKAAYNDGQGGTVETTATLFAWESDSPILVTDIDDTLCEPLFASLVGVSYDDLSDPLSGASEAMQQLAESFHIIYLTARPREYNDKTKRWLSDNGFPNGPLLMWDIDRDPWSQLDYKQERLDDLTGKFSKITIGIGNAQHDYTAYDDHAMFTILIDPESSAEKIDRGVRLPNWASVLELFEKNPQLYDLQSPDETIELP
jgi:hypothetical protein